MELKNGERIDDLQLNGLKIIQNEKGFCFGIDAVLLSDFAKNMKKADKIIDLCSGNGVVALLLTEKIKNFKKIYEVEVQEEVAEMAKRSIELNELEEKITIINKNLKDLKEEFESGTIDAITVNPPYKAKGSGIINEENALTIARHEVLCTIEDIIKESARLLKSGGNFYMVHRPERLVDIFYYMRKYKIEPKRIRFVQPNKDSAPNLVLIEGSRSGRAFLKFENPLCVYEKDGEYTEEIFKIYNMKVV